MENTVAQMSVSEFRSLITDVVADVIEEKLSHFADPDAGLEFRQEFVERIRQQDERIKNGERLIPYEEVVKELGLEDEVKP